MLKAIGLTDEQVYGSQKHEPLDMLCGQTPRHAMQTLGTEWGRECIGRELWLRVWEASLPPSGLIVVDDLRFANEAELIAEYGGAVVEVCREGHGPGEHQSEKIDFSTDFILDNNGSLVRLYEGLETIVQFL